MEKNNDFFIRSTFRTYLIPTILALLGTTITVLIDSIIIGNFIGEKGLAALNLVKPVYFTFMTLGSLISVGAAANASVYYQYPNDDENGFPERHRHYCGCNHGACDFSTANLPNVRDTGRGSTCLICSCAGLLCS